MMLLTLARERPDAALLAEMRRLVADDPDLAARVLTDLVVIAKAVKLSGASNSQS